MNVIDAFFQTVGKTSAVLCPASCRAEMSLPPPIKTGNTVGRVENWHEHKTQIGIYVFTAFIMFITDALVFEINANATCVAIKRYGVIIVAILLAVQYATAFKGKNLIHLLLLTIFPLTSSFLGGYLFNGYYFYSFVAGIWIGSIYTYKYSLSEFAKVYCNIMRVVCIASLICFFFRDILVDVPFFPIIESTKDNSYRWIGVISIPVKVHQRGRNFGPYWEPGTYQIYINAALCLSLFVLKDNKKLRDAIIFTATGLSTLSGIVLIPMLILYMAYAIENKRIKISIGILILAVIIYYIASLGVFDGMLSKLEGTDSNNSFLHRWIGFECGLRGFVHNPIFGSPPAYNDAVRTQLAWKYLSNEYASSANTFANLFAYFGIYVGCYLFYSSFKMFSSIGKGKMVTMLIFLAFVVATSNENLTTSTFFLAFCMLRNAPAKDNGDVQKMETCS